MDLSPLNSSKKFAATSARRAQRRDKDDDAAGAEAFAEMRTLMDGWTSSKVGTVPLSSPYRADMMSPQYEYERDPVEWLQRSVVDDPMMLEDVSYPPEDDDRLPLATPPKRAASLDRAATPVMSNSSSKKKQRQQQSATTPRISETPDSEIPMNVQSPWVSQQQLHGQGVVSPPYQQHNFESLEMGPMTMTTTMTPSRTDAIVERSSLSSRGSHHEYRRYHAALLSYLKAKRRLVERIDVEKRAKQLADQDVNMDTGTNTSQALTLHGFTAVADSTLVHEETRAEMDFMRALNGLCWDRANPQDRNMQDMSRKEGNFWLLLSLLRELGLTSLIWADDAASERQNCNALTAYMEELAASVHSTPLELISQLQAGPADCPAVLQRRQSILRWLEHCFSKLLQPGVTRPRHTNVLPNSQVLAREGLPETDKDDDLLRSSLALILAGRPEEAKKLARESGTPWRAALWSGGKPHGYKVTANNDTRAMDRETVGNTRRPVWRRMMWKLSEKLSSDRGASTDEGAIAAILSNHLKNALSNQSLRSWEKGLYATSRSIMGRLEDELLHKHNTNRRMMRPPFPGTDYETQEREHLFATSEVASMTEAGIVKVLASTPFEEMRGEDLVTEATASFLVGKGAIAAYVQDSHAHLETEDASSLRFLTHLALYLDSLAECTTPIFVQGVMAWKNDVLLMYLGHLSSREDLWHMLVLYASLLPDATLLDSLPELLTPIESHEERKVVVRQMRELLPRVGLDQILLQRVVHLILAEVDASTSTNTPTRLDLRKMKAIKWLCFADEHLGDALIYANTLLRRFLLSDKVASAFMFMQDIRPDELLQSLVEGADMEDAEDANTDSVRVARVEQARSEHLAFQSYLEAFRVVGEWREVVAGTNARTALVDDQLDKTQLNATEAAIASSMERRELVQEKRKSSHFVVTAADNAQKALICVLEHPGGWLLTEDEEIAQGDENMDMVRRGELQALRVKLLPDVVMLYHEVCTETASWMSSSLDDGLAKLGGTSESVLKLLDESKVMASSPLSPLYWTHEALELAGLVATDTYGINSACGNAELKNLMSNMAEAAVASMLYSTQRERFVSKLH